MGADPGADLEAALGIGAQRVLECSHGHVLARRGGKINCRWDGSRRGDGGAARC